MAVNLRPHESMRNGKSMLDAHPLPVAVPRPLPCAHMHARQHERYRWLAPQCGHGSSSTDLAMVRAASCWFNELDELIKQGSRSGERLAWLRFPNQEDPTDHLPTRVSRYLLESRIRSRCLLDPTYWANKSSSNFLVTDSHVRAPAECANLSC